MRRIMQAGFCALMLAGAPLAQDGFAIPTLSDFENESHRAFFESIANRIEGFLREGGLAVHVFHEPGSGRIAGYGLERDGPVVVAVDVTVNNVVPLAEEYVFGAGIAIRREAGTFYALLTDGTDYLLTAWVDARVVQRLGGTLPERPDDTPIRLELREAGAGVEFLVDGESRGSVSDSRIQGREAGLAVFGAGSYFFDNLYFTTQNHE